MDIQHISYDSLLFPAKIKENGKLRTLYYVGNIELLNETCIAVIGRRETSERYERISYQVGKVLAKNRYVVMNGLARGCDRYAIIGALSEGGCVYGFESAGTGRIYKPTVPLQISGTRDITMRAVR